MSRTKQYKNLRKFHGILGKAVIAGYIQWKSNKSSWEMGYFEGMGYASGGTSGERVQGGDNTPPQERALEIKTNDKSYNALCRRIKKAEAIFESLDKNRKAILDIYCWGGAPWHACAHAIGQKSRTGFFSAVGELEVAVGKAWEEDEDRVPLT